jgi:CRP-like cAMP-binding protein
MEMTLLTPPAVASSRRRVRQPVFDERLRIAATLSHACRPGVLSHDGALALAGEARVIEVSSGETVFSRQQPATDLWLVLEGRVALGSRCGAGALQQRRSAEAGGWIDLASALLRGFRLADEEAGPQTGSLQLQQRKRAVAQELGTTAETFSRTLAQLSRTGLIEVRGYSIRLLDVPALRMLADGA